MEITWSTKEDLKQQRTAICIKIHEEIYKDIRNYKTTIDSIPFSNRWTDRED